MAPESPRASSPALITAAPVSPVSPAAPRRRNPAAVAGLAPGWLLVAAYLVLLARNAGLLPGVSAPVGGLTLARLIALPALPLAPAFTAQAAAPFAAIMAALALVLSALTFAPPASRAAPAAVTAPAPPRADPPPVETLAQPPALSPRPLGEGPGVRAAPRRVFISHSSGDNAFGYALTDWLRAELGPDYEVFYDSHGGQDDSIPAATYWQDVIQAKLMAADVFVVIETPAAMASKWVQDEMGLAWSRKNSASVELGLVVAPILREPCGVAPWLTLIQYADFHPGADEAVARARLLAAIRDQRTHVKPQELVGPPFDLSVLRPSDHFIGRADAVDWVVARLTGPADAQLANIAAANGQGGIGKTALAAEVVRRLMAGPSFGDGIAALDCRDKHSEADALSLLQDALARFIDGRKKPEDADFAALGDVARRLFGGKRALIVLDNVEADLPAGKIIAPLRAAGAAVLLTSRTPLAAASGGASLRLDLLPEPDALALFISTYGRDLSDAQSADARRIVLALGRHTLAVKLAAAYAATQDRSLAALADAFERNPLREAWLENAEVAVAQVLETSVKAMSHGGRRLFAALGAVATADVGRMAALALASALGDDENEAERSLRWILDLRLANPAELELPAEHADRERLRLHPLTQAYARDLFSGQRSLPDAAPWDDAQREQADRALAAWYADYSNMIYNQDDPAYLALAPDEENIIGALERAKTPRDDLAIADICDGLRGFWRDTGRTRAGLRWLPVGAQAAERIANETGKHDDQMRSAWLTDYWADVLLLTGRLDEAEAAYTRNLAQWRAIPDRKGEGAVLSNLGQVALRRGQLEEAAGYFTQSLPISQAVGDRRGEGVDLFYLAQTAERRNDLDAAERLHRESLALGVEVQDGPGIATSLEALGAFLIEHGRGEPGEGCAMLGEAVALWHAMGLTENEEQARATARELGCG